VELAVGEIVASMTLAALRLAEKQFVPLLGLYPSIAVSLSANAFGTLFMPIPIGRSA